MKTISINPYTEEVLGEFKLLTSEECSREVKKSRRAFYSWKIFSMGEKAERIRKVGEKLRRNKRRFAEIITNEMGKPISQSIAEVEKCTWLCDYYAENLERFLEDEVVETEASKSYVTFEPLGIILGIMPWNFPFWQVFRYAIPALSAGNVCLLKHASNVPKSALEIQKVFQDSDFPPHVFKTLLMNSETAMKLIEGDKIDGVSLTGSVKAGSQVGSLAAKHIKKLVLELGGSDPFIVLEDAEIKRAAQMAVQSRLINTGQSCIAAKRFLIIESIRDEFQEAFVENLKTLKIGDPMDEDTDIGPIAKKEFVAELEEQLEDAVNKGARIIFGPEPQKRKGFFFQPVVVTNVKSNMRVLKEEVFGPIAPIMTAKSEEEAIKKANDTKFGLAAAIWSKNTERAEKLAKKINSGFIAINDIVISDPRLPFGGIKQSGVGRELSHYGVKEFVNIKSVIIK